LLMNRGARIAFFHDYTRRAVQSPYLTDGESRRAAHRRLADYFAGREIDERQLEELPWQLQHAGQWEWLKDYISAIPIYLALDYGDRSYELIGYWNTIGERFDVVEAEPLIRRSLTIREKLLKPDHEDLADSLSNLAWWTYAPGNDYDEGERLYLQALSLYEKVWVVTMKRPYFASLTWQVCTEKEATCMAKETNTKDPKPCFLRSWRPRSESSA